MSHSSVFLPARKAVQESEGLKEPWAVSEEELLWERDFGVSGYFVGLLAGQWIWLHPLKLVSRYYGGYSENLWKLRLNQTIIFPNSMLIHVHVPLFHHHVPRIGSRILGTKSHSYQLPDLLFFFEDHVKTFATMVIENPLTEVVGL